MATIIRGSRTPEDIAAARKRREEIEGGILSTRGVDDQRERGGFRSRIEDRLSSVDERFSRRHHDGTIPPEDTAPPVGDQQAGNGGQGDGGTGTQTPTPTPNTPAPNPQPFGSTDPFVRLNENLTAGSPLIDFSKAESLAFANSRGLANSTIAGDAGVRAAISAAGPFALQGAAQANEREAQVSAQEHQAFLQGRDIASAKELALINASTQRDVANIGASANKSIATLNAQTQAEINTLRANTDLAIQEMNVQASQQQAAATAASNAAAIQAQMYAAIMNNPNISAADRAAYLADISNITAANLGLVEGLYNIDLNWGAAGTGGTAFPSSTAAAGAALTPGMQTAQAIIDAGAFRNEDLGTLLKGGLVGSNVIGADNASAIQDIAAALSRGEAITTAQWAQAGYGPGGSDPNAPAPQPQNSAVPTGGALPQASTPTATAPAAPAAPQAFNPATFNPSTVPPVISGSGLQAKFPQPGNPSGRVYIGGAAYISQLSGMERRGEVPAGTVATVEAAFRAAGYIR